MDRTAWIAITLCVLGLVVWQIYVVNQTRPKPLSAGATPAATLSPSPTFAASPAPPPFGSPAAIPSPSPIPATPAFTEVKETLRNSDVEFHLTNRGGGIAEAVLLHHTAEGGKRVSLNSGDHIPIGAIVDNPAAPSLPEYKMTRQGDAVEFEYVMPEQVTIRKKYFFAPTQDKKDNYLAELDVDVQNAGVNPYTNSGYYLALGSAAPIHPKDYPSYTVACYGADATGGFIDDCKKLPPGLKLKEFSDPTCAPPLEKPACVVISGKPTRAGRYTFRLSAPNLSSGGVRGILRSFMLVVRPR